MKAIKNNRCVELSLKHELEKLRKMSHPNLVQVESVNLSDYYSYVVFKRLSKFMFIYIYNEYCI